MYSGFEIQKGHLEVVKDFGDALFFYISVVFESLLALFKAWRIATSNDKNISGSHFIKAVVAMQVTHFGIGLNQALFAHE